MPANGTPTAPIICARLAGILYLFIIAFGIASEGLIRAHLVVAGDASTTASQILASQSLFRLGFVFDSLMLLADVAIAILFYVLLKPVSNLLSLLAAAFRFMQAAILGSNLLNYFAALLLLRGSGDGATIPGQDFKTLALFFLDMHSYGYDLGLIFFGISNLILGYLVIRSPYFPAVIGYGLMSAALVYVSGSYTHFVWPNYLPLIEPLYGIPLLAELAFAIWLLVKGVRGQAHSSLQGNGP